MKHLRSVTLSKLDRAVAIPRYDRSLLSHGIVHIGLGHFHRAHQALYLDDLMNQGKALDWAICGIGVRPNDLRMRDVLRSQDHLYTLTSKQPDGSWDSRIVGSIQAFHYVPDDPEAAIEQIAAPATRIVTLTITEGGYGFDEETGEFTADSDIIREDLSSEYPTATAFGVVLQAMQRRRTRGESGLTILSCDNIEENGEVARTAFLGFARLKDQATAAWMEEHLTFPSSMVDRVTPGTVEADLRYVEDSFGYHDGWPVTCEPFRQWVIEDRFAAGRPPFEEAAVDVVADVAPYEVMKLRLANGVHQALCYSGHLLGHSFVHEAVADPDIRAMLLRYIDNEAVPTLKTIPGVDFHAYGRMVLDRFGNAQMKDPLTRICAETSDRIPKFLLPVARERLAAGGDASVCAAVVASWARYAEGEDEGGRSIAIIDSRRDLIMSAAQESRNRPVAFLENRSLFGTLSQQPTFVTAYEKALARMRTDGMRAAVQALA